MEVVKNQIPPGHSACLTDQQTPKNGTGAKPTSSEAVAVTSTEPAQHGNSVSDMPANQLNNRQAHGNRNNKKQRRKNKQKSSGTQAPQSSQVTVSVTTLPTRVQETPKTKSFTPQCQKTNPTTKQPVNAPPVPKTPSRKVDTTTSCCVHTVPPDCSILHITNGYSILSDFPSHLRCCGFIANDYTQVGNYWQERRRVDYMALHLKKPLDLLDTHALFPQPYSAKPCPCSQDEPIKRIVQPITWRAPKSLRYASIRETLKMFSCLEPFQLVHKKPPLKEGEYFLKRLPKKPYPQKMFETMVDEMKDLLSPNNLDNYENLFERACLTNTLGPIELLLKMTNVSITVREEKALFLIAQIILRATYRRKNPVDEANSKRNSGQGKSKIGDRTKIVLPQYVLPDVVTHEMLEDLYKQILTRLESRNPYIVMLFADPRATAPGTVVVDIPKTIEDLIDLSVSFFNWWYVDKDYFLERFLFEREGLDCVRLTAEQQADLDRQLELSSDEDD